MKACTYVCMDQSLAAVGGGEKLPPPGLGIGWRYQSPKSSKLRDLRLMCVANIVASVTVESEARFLASSLLPVPVVPSVHKFSDRG